MTPPKKISGAATEEKRTNANILSERDVKREMLGNILSLWPHYFSGSPLTKQMLGYRGEKQKRGIGAWNSGIWQYQRMVWAELYQGQMKSTRQNSMDRYIVKKGAEVQVVANRQKWQRQPGR